MFVRAPALLSPDTVSVASPEPTIPGVMCSAFTQAVAVHGIPSLFDNVRVVVRR